MVCLPTGPVRASLMLLQTSSLKQQQPHPKKEIAVEIKGLCVYRFYNTIIRPGARGI